MGSQQAAVAPAQGLPALFPDAVPVSPRSHENEVAQNVSPLLGGIHPQFHALLGSATVPYQLVTDCLSLNPPNPARLHFDGRGPSSRDPASLRRRLFVESA